MYDEENKQELVSYASKIAKQKNLKIKYVSQRKIKAFVGQKYCLGIGPEEFLDMVAIAESTPGPMAVNSATYIGYKLEGVPGAAASTLAVCLPSFAVIYAISLFFDQFLQLSVVSSAFRGIQVCVVYLVLSAGLKMLKNLKKDAFSRAVLAAVLLAMVSCSVLAVSFSSIFYILLSGAAGLAVYGVQQLRKEAGAK